MSASAAAPSPGSRASVIAARHGLTILEGVSPEGTTNKVWLLPNDVLRIARRKWMRTLAIEARLAPKLPITVGYPPILDHGRLRKRDWILQRRIAGVPFGKAAQELTPEQTGRGLADIVAIVGELHNTPVPSVIAGRPPCFLVMRSEQAQKIVTRLQRGGFISADDARKVLKTHAKMLRSVRHEIPVWSHGDMHLNNALWEPEKQRISAALDFEAAGVAPDGLDYYVLCSAAGKELDQAGRNALAEALPERFFTDESIKQFAGFGIARTLAFLDRLTRKPNAPGARAEIAEKVAYMLACVDRTHPALQIVQGL